MPLEPGQWKRVEELFDEAIALPRGERDAWLSGQCGGDAALASEVQSLLDSYDEQERVESPRTSEVPERFGPFCVDRQIGQGGMGAVYLAHRDDGQFEQRVAIKVVARAVFGEVFLERFRMERQILASLNHPGIARLVDGGMTPEGALYLAMEYVDGMPIDRYCAEKLPGRRDRLRLFQSVCSAVQYAHRNLVVHRDLKPDNILVQEDGVAKLLDFGTAKLLTPIEEAADSGLTQAGFRAFTPAYASPEQILGNPVTTASDVYSLGVILYRLLANRPPYDLKDQSTGALIKVVCEEEAPSAGADPDLDAIVAKCLRKDPAERYRSVDELMDDIGFYLENRPIHARRVSMLYRARKLAMRNKLATAVSILLVASIAAGTGAALWQARIARARYQDLRRLTNSLLFELHDVIRELPGSTAAQKILVTRVLDNLDKLASGAANDRVLQADLLEAYLQMGNLQGNPYEQNLGDTDGGMATLRKALTISERLAASGGPPDNRLLRTQAMIKQSIGDIYFGTGHPKEAIEYANAAAAMLDQLASAPGATAQAIVEAGITYETLGDEYGQPGVASMGDIEKSTREYKKTLEFDQRALALDPTYVRARRGIAVIEMKLGNLQLETDPETALVSFLTALRTFDALPEKDASTPGSRRIRSAILRKGGRAFELIEDYVSALRNYRESLAIEESFAAIDPEDSRAQYQLAVDLDNMATAQESSGDRQGALETNTRARGILETLLRRDPGNQSVRGPLAEVLRRTAALLRTMGRGAEAGPLGVRAAELAREVADRSGATALDLCRAAQASADLQRAVSYAERCVEMSGRMIPENFRILALAYEAAGRTEDKRRVAREGLVLMPDGERRGWVRQALKDLAK